MTLADPAGMPAAAGAAAGASGTFASAAGGSGQPADGGGFAAAAAAAAPAAASTGSAAADTAARTRESLPSLFSQAQSLLRELPGLVSDRFELLSLELQRAGGALAKIVALVFAALFLAVTAWLVLWAAVVGALMALGLHWSAALFVVLLVNLGCIAVALLWAKRLLPLLQLPATRRHLTPTPSPRPNAPPHTGTARHDRQPPSAAGRPVAP